MKTAVTLVIIVCVFSSPASAQDAVLVTKAESKITSFLDVFSDVKCTEQVRQEKLKKSGKVEYEELSTFDYLVIAQGSGDDLSLSESRLEQSNSPHKKNVSLLVTNGFATLLLIFHPRYSSSFEFSPGGTEVVDGRPVVKVGFRHIKGRSTPMALLLRGRLYPLELEGTAWIDPESGTITRIRSELQDSMEDVGLHGLAADVTYSAVDFQGADRAWLPANATIDVETLHQHWRNVHTFSHYQRFSVTTVESVKDSK